MENNHTNKNIRRTSLTDSIEILTIPSTCKIEDIYVDDKVPSLMKSIINDSFSWQQRGKTSLRESLLLQTLDPRWLALLTILGAIVKWDNHPESKLADDLQLIGRKGSFSDIKVPIYSSSRWIGESHVSLTPKDSPIVCTFASICDQPDSRKQINLVIFGATQQRLFIPTLPSVDKEVKLLEEYTEFLVQGIIPSLDPPEDYRGSKIYRIEMAKVTVMRALKQCLLGENIL